MFSLPAERRINGVFASARRVDVVVAGLVRSWAGRELRTLIETFCPVPAREAG